MTAMEDGVFSAVNAVIPTWLAEEPGFAPLVVGKTFVAPLELWPWEVQPTEVTEDSLTQLQGADAQGHAGALYELVGDMQWWFEDRAWFLETGGLVLAGESIILGKGGGPARFIPVVTAYVPLRALVTATIVVASGGAWAYWPEANASRNWMVNSIIQYASYWLLNLSPKAGGSK